MGILSLMIVAAGAEAQEGGASEWFSGNVSVVSDYPFRGISQTLEEPALQGGIDLVHPIGFYLGTWGSSVNFGEPDLSAGARAQVEIDVYGGYRASLLGLADLDLGYMYVGYPGADGGRNYDFMEFGLGASRGIGGVNTGLSFKYSPDFFAGSGQGLYYGATLGIPVSVLTISGTLARQSIEENATFGAPDYTEYGLGATAGWMGLNFGARLIGTDISEGECFNGTELCKPRVVFSLARVM